MHSGPAPLLARCENCAAALAGAYCHVCGQHAHSPLRNFRHAMEDVFESFWHLDGRIFRTLADLLVPGRVACNYLAGRRVRYIAPLRLFVILSLLTFFVGKSTLHMTGGEPQPGQGPGIAVQEGPIDFARGDPFFSAAEDPAAVMRMRREQMAEVSSSVEGGLGRLMRPVLEQGMRRELDAGARRRLAALGMDAASIAAMLAREPLAVVPPKDTAAHAPAAGTPAAGWQERWLTTRSERLASNVERMTRDPDVFIDMFLGALPSALFVLVPLFAMFLKVMYLGSGRGYLEHLVVALYSHALLLMGLLAMFVMVGLGHLLPAVDQVVGLLGLSLAMAVALYLLWTQKRVYAQRWRVTLFKYVVIGGGYSLLLSFAIVYALLSGLTR
ncbi:MAG TPA: DUF3667 domain-containing protein [Luteimonas sp.]|nr:DUF3667 domain-containing protein [Luteimonas sp.]